MKPVVLNRRGVRLKEEHVREASPEIVVIHHPAELEVGPSEHVRGVDVLRGHYIGGAEVHLAEARREEWVLIEKG